MYDLLNESTENFIERMGFGKRMQEVGLVVPLEYTVITTDKMTTMILLSELRKKKEKYKHWIKLKTLLVRRHYLQKRNIPTI